jgi:outer membrane immunogenic protein
MECRARCCVFRIFGILLLLIGVPAGARASEPLLAPGDSWYNWTGIYLGGNLGGGWGSTGSNGSETSRLGNATFNGSGTSSGWVGGGQVGGNFEIANRWVIGLEADGDWTEISGSSSGCSTLATGATSGCGTNHAQLDDFGTARGRFGYAFSNLLLYGTGGWAWANSSGSHTTTCVSSISPLAQCPGKSTAFTGGTASFSDSLTGWTAGAGVEWGFLRNWTFRVEYLHVQFDNVSSSFATTITTGGGTVPVASSVSSNNNFNIVRMGFNFLFK